MNCIYYRTLLENPKDYSPCVYLAGKSNGDKYNLIADQSDYYFTASDYLSDPFIPQFSDLLSKELVNERFIAPLNQCKFMLAYIDRLTQYGTIAEIATAAAKGKKVYAILNRFKTSNELLKIKEKTEWHDLYWFTLSLPNVITYETNDFQKSKEIAKQILDLLK